MSDKEKLKLLPCPFCGSKAELCTVKRFDGEITLAFIRCNSCGSLTRSYSTEMGAIEAWNKRI